VNNAAVDCGAALRNCLIYTKTKPFKKAGYRFLKGLINQDTGLVHSLEGEHFTTVYKNALAAMAFIRNEDIFLAENIFNFFQSKLTSPFPGFRQNWDPCTGQEFADSPYWEGDNAFLLLALNYYKVTTGSYGRYDDLAFALKGFLASRANSADSIVAEGLANMYAAVEPFGNDFDNWQILSKLQKGFIDSKNYEDVTDHIVRGILVFGDISGYAHLNGFRRSERWQCNDNIEVTAFAAFRGDSFINVEISAQLLVTQRLWQDELGENPSPLRFELEKLKLRSEQSAKSAGLPFHVRHPVGGGFSGDYSMPILDSTVWLLFDNWRFNPFAPGKLHAGCQNNRFIPLITSNQSLGFPRSFRFGINSVESFPQEINEGDHKQIVIEFTTSQDLSRIPITFVIDTVARNSLELKLTLDDTDHCLGICDRTASYPITIQDDKVELSLPIQCDQSAPGSSHTYQLILEGVKGFGVFDWLQLKTNDTVLWTIGENDNRCIEFDNNGFIFNCVGQ
jgi:hypothetical protein